MAQSPRSSPRGKPWQGRMKTWNRDALRKVNAQLSMLAAHDSDMKSVKDDTEDAVSETQSRTSKISGSPRKVSLERLRPQESPQRGDNPSGLNFKQTSKTRMKQIHEMRDADERMIADKCARERFERELKFEKAVEEIQVEDEQRRWAGRVLADQAEKNNDAQKKLYDEWNQNVNGRIVYQLFRSSNPNLAFLDDYEHEKSLRRPGAFTARGGENSDLRRNIRVGDDPLKRGLISLDQEDKFRRTADSIIFGSNPHLDMPQSPVSNKSHGFGMTTKEGPSLEELDKLWDSRDTSRTVLEPTTWGQLHYQSTSYGFFASSRRNDNGTFFTQRRMTQAGVDAHLPQIDGIDPGGTLKTRLSEINNFGILTGEWGRQGQTSNYKQPHGASCGAPAQDHYAYESGLFVTDQEFPLGRKMFRNMH
eukprot:gnl/MRDRNA2_/MRDRNA2_37520_c0_seq1.p1 gnl/MRDRNA2_/MRDRNA2_37520_c0~~gnl/MRDRNA2_/MRDRNA2_37520_c0_seq1.p1  ORF type:complete len:420 (+),score=75.86 gnl/MRDRNA2_/MRDRNA2_37520_c0_seq1:104-1363(+)